MSRSAILPVLGLLALAIGAYAETTVFFAARGLM